VHLGHLRLRDFRNYPRMDQDFGPGFHLIVGANAQGKTNLLEAIYLLATLRSFRGVGSAEIVRHGAPAYFVGGQAVSTAEQQLKVYWSAGERKLSVDGQPVRRLSEYFGRLRCVVFCAEDLKLINGPARVRRRFMDLLLAHSEPDYLPLLQRYMRALRARNALLKKTPFDEAVLAGFTRELVAAGAALMKRRGALVPSLVPLVRQAYRRIAGEFEELEVSYRPAARDLAVELAQSRARERTYRTTLVGPHRDELQLLVDRQDTASFASEGQKRSLAIALKMAQAEYLEGLTGSPPILLIDDVMGELDPRRRAGLLPLLERSEQARGQVFMTCTQENWPQELSRRLWRWEVKAGQIHRLSDHPS
jgi:DNA replication and repair protein RecF